MVLRCFLHCTGRVGVKQISSCFHYNITNVFEHTEITNTMCLHGAVVWIFLSTPLKVHYAEAQPLGNIRRRVWGKGQSHVDRVLTNRTRVLKQRPRHS